MRLMPRVCLLAAVLAWAQAAPLAADSPAVTPRSLLRNSSAAVDYFALCGAGPDGLALLDADGKTRIRNPELRQNTDQDAGFGGGCDCARDADAEKAYAAAHDGEARVVYLLANATDGSGPETPAVCAPWDCACDRNCHRCRALGNYLGGTWVVFQVIFFVGFIVSTAYNAFVLREKLQHEAAKQKRKGGRAKGWLGVNWSIPLLILCANLAVNIVRVIWILDPMLMRTVFTGNKVFAEAGLYTNEAQGVLLKIPQIVCIANSLLLILVYKELLQNAKKMKVGQDNKKKRRIVGCNIVLLFVLGLPPSFDDNMLLRTIGNLSFAGFALALLIGALYFGFTLSKMLAGDKVAPAEESPQELKMRRVATKLKQSVTWNCVAGAMLVVGVGYNMVFHSHINQLMTFYYMVHGGELLFCISLTYSLKVDKSGKGNAGSSASTFASKAPESKAVTVAP